MRDHTRRSPIDADSPFGAACATYRLVGLPASAAENAAENQVLHVLNRLPFEETPVGLRAAVIPGSPDFMRH
jgi:hypothetical protein